MTLLEVDTPKQMFCQIKRLEILQELRNLVDTYCTQIKMGKCSERHSVIQPKYQNTLSDTIDWVKGSQLMLCFRLANLLSSKALRNASNSSRNWIPWGATGLEAAKQLPAMHVLLSGVHDASMWKLLSAETLLRKVSTSRTKNLTFLQSYKLLPELEAQAADPNVPKALLSGLRVADSQSEWRLSTQLLTLVYGSQSNRLPVLLSVFEI